MKRTFYFLTLLSGLLFGSCQHDENPVIPDSPKKLSYYTEDFDISGLGFEPQLRVNYEYDDSGKLARYTFFGFNPDTESLEEQRHFEFFHTSNQVINIKGYLVDAEEPYIEYLYQYLPDGRVSRITENNFAADVNSEANFTYTSGESVKVAYTFSNGGSFEYEFQYGNENILSDKTTRGSQLCSDGQYTYDQHINPFRNLGYIDYALTNLSANNKLTENVNYVACSFPNLIPQSYAYEYDEKGYPTTATTFYKSDDDTATARKKFFYE